MRVKFHDICDRCERRSGAYSPFATCRHCGEDICPDCAEPGTTIEPDVDSPETCICKVCAVKFGVEE